MFVCGMIKIRYQIKGIMFLRSTGLSHIDQGQLFYAR